MMTRNINLPVTVLVTVTGIALLLLTGGCGSKTDDVRGANAAPVNTKAALPSNLPKDAPPAVAASIESSQAQGQAMASKAAADGAAAAAAQAAARK